MTEPTASYTSTTLIAEITRLREALGDCGSLIQQLVAALEELLASPGNPHVLSAARAAIAKGRAAL